MITVTATPPVMQNMQLCSPNTYAPPKYNSSGQVIHIAQLDLSALEANINMLSDHQHMMHQIEVRKNKLLAEHIKDMERKVEDAMALMYYTIKYYPEVVKEFQIAEKAKLRMEPDSDT